jgi:hypothetical protein
LNIKSPLPHGCGFKKLTKLVQFTLFFVSPKNFQAFYFQVVKIHEKKKNCPLVAKEKQIEHFEGILAHLIGRLDFFSHFVEHFLWLRLMERL